MKKKRVFAIGSLLTTVMLSLLLLTAPTTSAVGTFGAIQGLSHHHLVAAKKAIPIRAYGISTQRAQALAMQFSKGKITTRSLRRIQHRVQQQLPIKATKKFTSPTYTSSSNWAGYVADTAGTIYQADAVSGAFNVSPESGTVTASWVGLGGFNSGSLIQTGVDQSIDATWYELLPDYPVYLYYVNPGDTMYGEVALDSSNGLWYVLIWDETTGNWYSNEFSYATDTSTAVWIVEVQPNGAVPYFDPVNFSYAQWEDNYGSFQDMTSNEEATLWNITLVSPVGGYVCASDPSSSQSFTAYVC